MNVFALSTVASPGVGILAALFVAQRNGLGASGTVAMVLAGAVVGFAIYGASSFIAVRIAKRAEGTGKQAVITSVGVFAVVVVAASPFVTWWFCTNVFALVVLRLAA